MARRESNWSWVEDEIARLLPEIHREGSANEIPGDPALLDEPSIATRLIRAALLVLGAALIIVIVSPFLAWIAAFLTR